MQPEMPHWVKFPDQPGVVFANIERVNIDDLLSSRPGRVVRCYGNPSEVIRYIPPQLLFDCYGFIAGLVSEDA